MSVSTLWFQESHMLQAKCHSDREQAITTMIALTRISTSHRVIVAGNDGMELYLALRRRGFTRVSTPATSRIPRQQHAIGLIAGRGSPTDIEALLDEIEPYLGASAGIAVLINSHDGSVCSKIRTRLQQLGFRIEAGARCQQGLVLAAFRQGFVRLRSAA